MVPFGTNMTIFGYALWAAPDTAKRLLIDVNHIHSLAHNKTTIALLAQYRKVQPRLSEHAGTRKNIRIIESWDNQSCLYINAFMSGPRRSVQIIEVSQ